MRSLQANFMEENKTLQQSHLKEKQQLTSEKEGEISKLKQRVLDDQQAWREIQEEKIKFEMIKKEESLRKEMYLERDRQIEEIIGKLSVDNSKLIERMNRQ